MPKRPARLEAWLVVLVVEYPLLLVLPPLLASLVGAWCGVMFWVGRVWLYRRRVHRLAEREAHARLDALRRAAPWN